MKIIQLLLFILLVPTLSSAQIIFSETFDDQADTAFVQPTAYPSDFLHWQGEPDIPEGWAGVYILGSMLDASVRPGNTMQIGEANRRGATGKAVTFWQEGRFGGDWSSDEQLMLSFSGRTEVWVRFYIKFDPGWQWVAGEAYNKIIRFTHFSGVNPIQYFQGGSHHPIGAIHTYHEGSSNDALQAIFRYDNVYFPDGATPSHPRYAAFYPGGGNFGGGGTFNYAQDGLWHEFILGVKLNSAAGVADGEWHCYVDGNLEYSDTTLAWIDTGGDMSHTWNFMVLGGNDYNFIGNTLEQYYSVDDVVVATTLQEAIDGPTGPVYDAPIVEILTESQSTTEATITIIGTLTTDSALTGTGVDVNGVTATADDGAFDEAVEAWTALGVTLSLGANTITATGTDSDLATDIDTVSITRTVPVKTSKINGAAVLKGAVIHQ